MLCLLATKASEATKTIYKTRLECYTKISHFKWKTILSPTTIDFYTLMTHPLFPDYITTVDWNKDLENILGLLNLCLQRKEELPTLCEYFVSYHQLMVRNLIFQQKEIVVNALTAVEKFDQMEEPLKRIFLYANGWHCYPEYTNLRCLRSNFMQDFFFQASQLMTADKGSVLVYLIVKIFGRTIANKLLYPQFKFLTESVVWWTKQYIVVEVTISPQTIPKELILSLIAVRVPLINKHVIKGTVEQLTIDDVLAFINRCSMDNHSNILFSQKTIFVFQQSSNETVIYKTVGKTSLLPTHFNLIFKKFNWVISDTLSTILLRLVDYHDNIESFHFACHEFILLYQTLESRDMLAIYLEDYATLLQERFFKLYNGHYVLRALSLNPPLMTLQPCMSLTTKQDLLRIILYNGFIPAFDNTFENVIVFTTENDYDNFYLPLTTITDNQTDYPTELSNREQLHIPLLLISTKFNITNELYQRDYKQTPHVRLSHNALNFSDLKTELQLIQSMTLIKTHNLYIVTVGYLLRFTTVGKHIMADLMVMY